METTAKDLFVIYLEKTLNWLESAGTFVADQIPIFVQEVLAWAFWENVFFATIFLLIVIVDIIGAIQLGKKVLWKREATHMMDGFNFFLSVLSFLPVLFVIGLFGRIANVIKVLVAPRLYLLEYVKDLL